LAASWAKKVEEVGKIVFSVGFQKELLTLFGRVFFLLRLALFERFFSFSVLHCHGVSLSGSRVFVAWLAASWAKKVEKVEKMVASVGFHRISEGTFGTFGRFFPLLHPSLP